MEELSQHPRIECKILLCCHFPLSFACGEQHKFWKHFEWVYSKTYLLIYSCFLLSGFLANQYQIVFQANKTIFCNCNQGFFSPFSHPDSTAFQKLSRNNIFTLKIVIIILWNIDSSDVNTNTMTYRLIHIRLVKFALWKFANQFANYKLVELRTRQTILT